MISYKVNKKKWILDPYQVYFILESYAMQCPYGIAFSHCCSLHSTQMSRIVESVKSSITSDVI